jgi:hypothetical protein
MHARRQVFGQMLRRSWELPVPRGRHSDCRRKIWSRRRWIAAVSEKSVRLENVGLWAPVARAATQWRARYASKVGRFHLRSRHGSNGHEQALVVVYSVWSGIQRGIESNTPRSLPDLFRTSSRAASFLRGRHPARRPAIRKATCGTYREPESSGVLCRNGDAVSGRDKG